MTPTVRPVVYVILGALALGVLVADLATALSGGRSANPYLAVSMALLVVWMALSYRSATR